MRTGRARAALAPAGARRVCKGAIAARARWLGAVLAALVLAASGAARAQAPRPATDKPPATAARTETQVPATSAQLDQQDATFRARFNSPDLLEAPIDPDTYVLGPHDLLTIMLLVGDTRTHQLLVLPEGVVIVPNVGAVEAAGRTLTEFRVALQAAMARHYRDFELYCYLARPRQFRVYVTGEVGQPGLLAARATERASDLVERAGGLTELGSQREIELRDATGAVRARVDLARWLARGEFADNLYVRAGDVVHVPPRGRQVAIQGEVRDPGSYEARRGESLRDLLALAGGPTAVADLSRVTVERTDSMGSVSIATYDLRAESPSIDDLSRVTLLSTLLGKRRVFLITPDDRQQTLYVAPEETLADLVRRTAALPPDADLAGAQLATHDSAGRPVQVRVDLMRVLGGEQNRPLQDGDVLSVPGVKGYVYVSGSVVRPGRYAYRAEWTVNDYLGEAGGPSSGGSRDRVSLLGQDGRERSAGRRTPVLRGETVYVGRSLASRTASALGILINLTALTISVVALSR